LGERLEKFRLRLGGNTDPGVFDIESYQNMLFLFAL